MRDFDVTSAGVSAEQDRNHRMKVYFIMMAIRLACVLSLIWVRGWWVLLVAVGAIFLPYFAVLIANEAANTRGKQPEQPDQLQLTGQEEPDEPVIPRLIVVDQPADRRGHSTPPEHSAQSDTEGALADQGDETTDQEVGTADDHARDSVNDEPRTDEEHES
ncbi:DUF3099 domain-containing protein [Leucobacter chinensis]|uniref:DUF3099 domain-containing protein n=1 Tax=Leucobacter chinensis TaxID=2851010 RepID=UPI00350F1417